MLTGLLIFLHKVFDTTRAFFKNSFKSVAGWNFSRSPKAQTNSTALRYCFSFIKTSIRSVRYTNKEYQLYYVQIIIVKGTSENPLIIHKGIQIHQRKEQVTEERATGDGNILVSCKNSFISIYVESIKVIVGLDNILKN